MKPAGLPESVQAICKEFVQGLSTILGAKLYGVYVYGAAVFGDTGQPQDIDCHVILVAVPSDRERARLFDHHSDLEERFQSGEVDAYYVLLEDAEGLSPPENHLRLGIRDESWALHCAHVRAGRYLTLEGPEPTAIFPSPAWSDLAAALDHELRFIEANFRYPDYCILNLCRIIYSFTKQDVVVSKAFSGKWARDRFPEWESIIEAAMRSYGGEATPADDGRMAAEVKLFHAFATKHIRQMRDE